METVFQRQVAGLATIRKLPEAPKRMIERTALETGLAGVFAWRFVDVCERDDFRCGHSFPLLRHELMLPSNHLLPPFLNLNQRTAA
jgi:hypothetical protein